MTALFQNRLVRRFGLWYLAYEAASFVLLLVFGGQMLNLH